VQETTLRLAIEALAHLVREEYPAEMSLADVASTWGGSLTPEHVEALRSVESDPELALSLGH
jgi:hypothetical protein